MLCYSIRVFGNINVCIVLMVFVIWHISPISAFRFFALLGFMCCVIGIVMNH